MYMKLGATYTCAGIFIALHQWCISAHVCACSSWLRHDKLRMVQIFLNNNKKGELYKYPL